MDNNILACDYGLKQLEKIADIGCMVDFNQGLDARLVTDDVAYLLSKIKWIKQIRFAYDTKEQLHPLVLALKRLSKYGVKSWRIFVYVLLQDLEDSHERLTTAKKIGVTPFAQPYRCFTGTTKVPQWQKDMARWCNRKEIFKSTDFKDFYPRNNFKCSQYFNTTT